MSPCSRRTGGSPPESSLSEQSDAGTPASAGTGLAVPATNEYIACTVGPQYAIRAVPDAIDRAIRQRAKRDEKSLNAVVVDAIARGLELDAKPAVYTDLDDLIGTWQEDPEFDRAIADFERIDHRHNHQQRRRQP